MKFFKRLEKHVIRSVIHAVRDVGHEVEKHGIRPVAHGVRDGLHATEKPLRHPVKKTGKTIERGVKHAFRHSEVTQALSVVAGGVAACVNPELGLLVYTGVAGALSGTKAVDSKRLATIKSYRCTKSASA